MRLNIHKLIFNFLGLLKKIRFRMSYAKSPGSYYANCNFEFLWFETQPRF
jgi:hypothetical protein